MRGVLKCVEMDSGGQSAMISGATMTLVLCVHN